MFEAQLTKILDKYDFTLSGWTEVSQPKSLHHYKDWLKNGFAGEMNYLHSHLPLKESPEKLLAGARSVITVAQNYVPHPSKTPFALKQAQVALYAKGDDYHFWLKDRLKNLQEDLQLKFPEENFYPFADSSPVLERDFAYESGLGWIGKNSCLINEKVGSLFVIGGLLTTIDLGTKESPPRLLAADRCGTCTKCIDACPTGAFVAPRQLDSRKCISYLTIESKSVPEASLREKIGDWLFGCDICQTVCPWNKKAWGAEIEVTSVDREQLTSELRWIMTASNRQILKKFHGTPLTRAGKRLKRNAILVAANKGLKELLVEIACLKENEELTELCSWAENKLAD